MCRGPKLDRERERESLARVVHEVSKTKDKLINEVDRFQIFTNFISLSTLVHWHSLKTKRDWSPLFSGEIRTKTFEKLFGEGKEGLV